MNNPEPTPSPGGTVHGNLLTPAGWVFGTLRFGTHIEAVDATPADPGGNQAGYVLPGFVDLHVHGGGGRDAMEAGDAVVALARLHARHGTTSLLATTMTAPLPEVQAALLAIGAACAARAPGSARVLGAHLEGPYISPARLGAQPDHVRAGTLAELRQLATLAPLRVITLAPELAGHLSLIAALSEEGQRVQLGHSNASYDEGVAALRCGAAGFTHLFNAMSGMHHREPGLVGAALAHAEHAELIPDLLHVHPGAVRAALRAIPGLYCVTDATAAAGMPDGEYHLGRQTVHKCLGGVRLADGTLAGSALTMDQALRNLVTLGLSLAEASRRTSTLAADYLGEPLRGRLAPGCHADWVMLDRALAVQAVCIEGELIEF